MADVEFVVIGAGVVGLAIAQRLAEDHRVFVFDKEEGIGRHTSSHNSGVIHAGIYYPPGSSKTALCYEGNHLLYEWCALHNVRSNRLGKLIVAVDTLDIPALDAVWKRAERNGVSLTRVEQRSLRIHEPAVRAVEALWSPSSGVVDQMGLLASFAAVLVERGGFLALKHTVTRIERVGGEFQLTVLDPEGKETTLVAEIVINSAGLWADQLAGTLGYSLDGDEAVPRLRQRVNKGRYYDLVDIPKAQRPVHLIYPVPERHTVGLGVHVTIDIDGGVHLGPDTEWLEPGAELDYRSDDLRRADFLRAVSRYLPYLTEESITPGQVGYRPKLQRPGEEQADFLIWHDRGYVHLGGIESPGLTASLAIARVVEAKL